MFRVRACLLTVALFAAGCGGEASLEPTLDDDMGRTEELAFPGQLGEAGSGYFNFAGEPELVSYRIIEGMKVFEGDIILADPPATTTSPLGLSKALALAGFGKWPNGVVPYVIADDLPDKWRVRNAITHWENKTVINWVPRNGHKDYVLFRKGSGCSSYVGRIGGMQQIWLASGCSTGSTIHEMGHAIGLLHEHTRPNRDGYINIRWDNILPDYRDQFTKRTTANSDAYSTYDYLSIMHYSSYAFSRNGKPTIVKDNGGTIAYPVRLTDKDAAAVNQMY